MEPHLDLMRPLNSAMGAVAVLAGALVAAGQPLLSSWPVWLPVGTAMAVAFLYTAAGNTLNDYYDRRTDRINHRERPIPSKRVRPEAARKLSIALFASGASLALFIGYPHLNMGCILLAIVNLLLLAGYEMRLKATGFPGNLTVSWLTASLFLFGGAATQGELQIAIFPALVLVLALLAFLASVGREIIKGIEDVRGDRDRRTLPRVLGVRTSGYLAALWTFFAVGLSPLPVYPLGLFGPERYLPVVLLADGMFIYSVFVLFRNPRRASQAAKLAMLVALLAFLVGALVR